MTGTTASCAVRIFLRIPEEEPMTLYEKIGEAMKKAMKSGDRLRLETLRTLRAALMEKAIEKRGTGAR